MQTKLLFLIAVIVSTASSVAAQGSRDRLASPCDLACLERLAGDFPSAGSLFNEWAANFDVLRSADPNLIGKLTASSGEVGGFAAFRSILLDNITFKAEAAYSKTLESKVDNGVAAPLRLSSIKFVPTYALTYQLNFGKFVTATRQIQARSELEQARQLQRDADRAVVLKAYVEFEQVRAKFVASVDALRKADGARNEAEDRRRRADEAVKIAFEMTKSAKTDAEQKTAQDALRNATERALKERDSADTAVQNAQQKNDAAMDAFFIMKSKAIGVLTVAGRSFEDELLMQWANIAYPSNGIQRAGQ